MDITEAIAHLERQAVIKLELANAPRNGEASKAIGEKMRKDAMAIAMVLAVIPEGAK